MYFDEDIVEEPLENPFLNTLLELLKQVLDNGQEREIQLKKKIICLLDERDDIPLQQRIKKAVHLYERLDYVENGISETRWWHELTKQAQQRAAENNAAEYRRGFSDGVTQALIESDADANR
jgi:hypothetical protein